MKILIADKFEGFGLEALRELGHEVDFQPDLGTDGLVAALTGIGARVLIVRSTKIPAEVMNAAGNLGLIIRAGAGYDTIDTAAAGAAGIAVANCPGMNSTAVAELAFGFMLALDRRIPQQCADLRAEKWGKKSWAKFGRGLKGRTLGLIGFGQIGKLVAKRALAFEMDVLYQCRRPCAEFADQAEVKRVELDELLRSSDFVSLHVPATAETKNLINAARLSLMQRHAYLINTTRGSVVDQAALVAALRDGTIAGAAADVYADEPAAEDKTFRSAILGLPNFIGTHHIGASTVQAQVAVAEEAVLIVKQFGVDAGEVMHCVNSASLSAAPA